MTKHELRGLTRRQLLSRSLAAAGSLAVAGAGFIAAPNAAWALEVTVITPAQMATLLQMARDIYPHDQVPDQNYAVAVKGYDSEDAKALGLKQKNNPGQAGRQTIQPGMRVFQKGRREGGLSARHSSSRCLCLLSALLSTFSHHLLQLSGRLHAAGASSSGGRVSDGKSGDRSSIKCATVAAV